MRLVWFLFGVCAALPSDHEVREIPSGRRIFLVRPFTEPAAHWFLVTETTGIVVENFGRSVLALAYAKHGNLVFYETDFDTAEENDVAFEDVLTYMRDHIAKPVVVTYSGSSNVALRGLAKPHLADAARLLLYTCGPGTDIDEQMRRTTEWLRDRMDDTSYRMLRPLAQNPLKAAVPSAQFSTSFALTMLFGGMKYDCLIKGILCTEVFTEPRAEYSSFSAIAQSLYFNPVRSLSKLLLYDNWFEGWVDGIRDIQPGSVSVPIMAMHGSHDRWFDPDLTFTTLANAMPGTHNCTVARASHILYEENPDGVEACLVRALSLAR